MTHATHYYPEMGQTAPAAAVVIGRLGRGGYYVKWTKAAHAAVLFNLAVHKITIKNMEEFTTVDGQIKWSGMMTQKAYAKLTAAGIAATEALLD